MYAIQALESLTRSSLSKNLIKKPVLTPSLKLIDKSEIYSILEKNPGHPCLKISKPKKGEIFEPFEGIVKLRFKLKEMYEDFKENSKDTSSAPNKEAEKQVKALNKKVEDLKAQINGLEKRNIKLVSDLEEAKIPKEDPKKKAKTVDFENQNKQLKDNNNRLKKQLSELKKQMDGLKVIINQAGVREKNLVEKLEDLERSHEDLKKEYEHLAKDKDQLKDEKDKLVNEITKSGIDEDNLLGDTFRKMYFEKQNSKCIH